MSLSKKITISFAIAFMITASLLFIGYTAESVNAEANNGTITVGQQDGEYIKGTVTADSGYDVASVRYVFSDGSYEFAELESTGGTAYTYKYPVPTDPAKEIDEVVPEYFSTTKWDGAIDVSWYDSSKNSFEISTPAQLAGLAALVNGSYDVYTEDYQIKGNKTLIQSQKKDDQSLTGAQGGNVSDTIYFGMESMDFRNKTVKLTSNLDMGGVKSSAGIWSGPSWTPIGGSYPMDIKGTASETAKRDIHVIESHFNGVLDGDGHKIENLYCNRYTAKGFPYSQYIGLVGNLGGIMDEGGTNPSPDWVPTVKNLSVDGYIYGRRMVGGIVGGIGNPPGGVLIENCANHAQVKNTDSKGCGGIVGAGWGSGNIINCYNTGDVYSSYAYAGGICANNDGLNIYGCYNTGTIYGPDKMGRAIGGHDSGTYTIDNCYYLKGCDNDPDSNGWYKGTATRIVVNILGLQASQLKGTGAIKDDNGVEIFANIFDALNNNGEAYVSDSKNINGGYPILWFEDPGYDPDSSYTVTVAPGTNGTVSADKTGNQKAGTVIKLSNNPESGYVLDCYKANDKTLVGNYYTVGKEAVTLSGKFVELKNGKVKIDKDSEWTVSLDKKGLYIGDSGAEDVVDWQVLDGESVYQKDKLSVRAILDDDAVPEELNEEYTGDFSFKFIYKDKDNDNIIKEYTSDTNSEIGNHTVTADISGAYLQIEAVPKSENKTWMNLKDTSWYDSDKTAKSYTIGTAEELAGLAYLVNKENISFEDVTINLSNNISLKNSDGTEGARLWEGIGSSQNFFKGTFNGNNKTILDMNSIVGGTYSGLFKYCKNAVIKNITVKGTAKASGGASGIVGSMNGGTITNCISDVEVASSLQKAAGIVSYIDNGTTVSSCINKGEITGTSGVGGIVGISNGTLDVIKECTNYGVINGTSNENHGTGGIVGKNNGAIYGCANYGSVTSSGWYTGGITGCSIGKTYSKIYDSYNRGTVHSTSSYNGAAVGGIVGYLQYAVINNTYNAGKVTKSPQYVSTYFGSVCGRFNRSSSNKITYTYYLQGSCSKAIDTSNSNVSLANKDSATMKAASFVNLLNSRLQSGYPSNRKFVAVSGDYPEYTRLKDLATCKVTFAGELQGESNIVYKGGSISLPSPPAEDKGYKYVFTYNDTPWNGKDITTDVTVNVTKEAATYTATFMAKDHDGKVVTVGTKNFTYNTSSGASSIAEPELSNQYERPGYTVKWPSYKLDAEDITIKAVYKQQTVKGGATLTGENYYFIGAKSSGVITIAENANITLNGKNGMCNELRIVMEKNSKLTLKDVQLASEKSVLTVDEGCTVTLEGNCVFKGRCTEQTEDDKPLHATIDVNGNCTFEGTGSAYVTSAKDNACMDIASEKTYTHKGGTIKFYKDDRLGKLGGAIEAEEAGITIQGGTFASAINNDGLYAINVKTLKLNGGNALFCAEEDSIGKAILAENIDIKGGSLKAWAAYSSNNTYVYGNDAINCDSFKDKYYVYTVDVSNTDAPYSVKVDDSDYYSGNGLGLTYGKKEYKDEKDKYLYIWLKKNATDSPYAVSINKQPEVEITEQDVTRGYAASFDENNKVEVIMTDTFNDKWTVMAAAYDDKGKMLDAKSVDADSKVNLDFEDISETIDSVKVFVFEDYEKLIPAFKSYNVKQ